MNRITIALMTLFFLLSLTACASAGGCSSYGPVGRGASGERFGARDGTSIRKRPGREQAESSEGASNRNADILRQWYPDAGGNGRRIPAQ